MPVKNRSIVHMEDGRILTLFPNCLSSIFTTAKKMGIEFELCICDFMSTDVDVVNLIPDLVDCQINYDSGIFSRGRGLNSAAKMAKYSNLCFIDTDMLVGEEFIAEGLASLTKGRANFPICYSYRCPEHKDGWWRNTGHGMCFVTHDMWKGVGGVPEFDSWGKEDDIFITKIHKKYPIDRKNVQNYFHQWHPNDKDWKNRYGK